MTGLLPFFRLTKKRTIAMTKCDVGLVGLAVMGRNMVLNLEEKGFRVAVYNRTASKTEAFLAGEGKGKKIEGAYDPGDFAALLERPRVILLMVKAGEAVDKAIAALLPHLEEGDILMDGGNSFFEDTERRARELEEKGIRFLGVGISGGEEGARFGPSIMPGGSRAAWERITRIIGMVLGGGATPALYLTVATGSNRGYLEEHRIPYIEASELGSVIARAEALGVARIILSAPGDGDYLYSSELVERLRGMGLI